MAVALVVVVLMIVDRLLSEYEGADTKKDDTKKEPSKAESEEKKKDEEEARAEARSRAEVRSRVEKKKKDKKGLSSGEIVLIVFGALVVLSGIIWLMGEGAKKYTDNYLKENPGLINSRQNAGVNQQ